MSYSHLELTRFRGHPAIGSQGLRMRPDQSSRGVVIPPDIS